jgi:hypothetical protein
MNLYGFPPVNLLGIVSLDGYVPGADANYDSNFTAYQVTHPGSQYTNYS